MRASSSLGSYKTFLVQSPLDSHSSIRLSLVILGLNLCDKGINMSEQKYRLVTRSDFDGLVCAVLLKQQDLISDIKFVHPKDMQDGKIDITPNDIVTN